MGGRRKWWEERLEGRAEGAGMGSNMRCEGEGSGKKRRRVGEEREW